jgi:hypothetical protein
MEEELILINMMEKNDYFVRKNYSKLQERYGSEFIAVDKGQIIGHNIKLAALKDYLETKKQILQQSSCNLYQRKG